MLEYISEISSNPFTIFLGWLGYVLLRETFPENEICADRAVWTMRLAGMLLIAQFALKPILDLLRSTPHFIHSLLLLFAAAFIADLPRLKKHPQRETRSETYKSISLRRKAAWTLDIKLVTAAAVALVLQQIYLSFL